MDKIRIRGGRPLNGQIPISGAKNAALPLMATALLTDDTVTLVNVPRLADIDSMAHLLVQLAAAHVVLQSGADGAAFLAHAGHVAEAAQGGGARLGLAQAGLHVAAREHLEVRGELLVHLDVDGDEAMAVAPPASGDHRHGAPAQAGWTTFATAAEKCAQRAVSAPSCARPAEVRE